MLADTPETFIFYTSIIVHLVQDTFDRVKENFTVVIVTIHEISTQFSTLL